MKAWHYTADNLRDGQPIPKPGVKLVFDGEPKMCEWGYHASKRIIDALAYAPGHMIHRVKVGGTILWCDKQFEIYPTIIHENDKLVATERTILWTVNGEKLLRKFARMCALDVIHLWNPPDVVVKYLKTGDENLRAAAEDAAWSAAEDAAEDVAEDAAWSAGEDAARYAARAAARAAGGDVAEDAARDAARDAAQAAAWAAARAAGGDVAERDAAWSAAQAAAWSAARAAAWSAARAAARDKQNRRLTSMVTGAKNG